MKTLLITAVLLLSTTLFAQKVVLTVTPSATQPTGVTVAAYNFYRADTSGGQVLGTNHFPGSATPTYTDTTAVVGHTYYYKATAWCSVCNGGAGSESVFSNEVKVFIPVPVIVVTAPVLAQPAVTFP